MEPVDVVGFEGLWSPAAPDPDEVRVVPLPASRQQEAVDLVCERLPHTTRGEAGWHFDAPEVFDGLASVEAVDRHGGMLGVGFTGHPRFAPDGRAFQRVVVAREHEGRGIGRALRQALLERLPDATTDLVTGTFDDEPRSLEVAAHWGFGVEEHAIESQLDLADLPTPAAPPGVTLHDVPDLVFDDAEAVERMLLTSQTNPEAEQGWVFDLARLRALVSDNETPVCVVARVDGAPAAITFGGVSGATLMIAYSGVAPDHRGRGLMTLVKQRAHLSARAVGATVSRTANEEHNRGIRRINEALGYVVHSGVYRMSQKLAG
ncbi:GNAT family N-acetyltransferase [Terrabacter terrigena]|uniref:GNAT family N-acetyltransferase n=1 Tax=Terrabacter terrigena TaxID=574718 RepID=A0ABW3MWV7_9MICO